MNSRWAHPRGRGIIKFRTRHARGGDSVVLHTFQAFLYGGVGWNSLEGYYGACPDFTPREDREPSNCVASRGLHPTWRVATLASDVPRRVNLIVQIFWRTIYLTSSVLGLQFFCKQFNACTFLYVNVCTLIAATLVEFNAINNFARCTSFGRCIDIIFSSLFRVGRKMYHLYLFAIFAFRLQNAFFGLYSYLHA